MVYSPKRLISTRTDDFTESVIREMTRLNREYKGVNLAQGFPDFNPPEEIIEAAEKALRDGYNQYAITWGSPRLRQAISEKALSYNGITADPDKKITVTCGATEAMMAAMMAVIDPGDEVILFEPFYENYGPDSIVSGAKPVYVRQPVALYVLDMLLIVIVRFSSPEITAGDIWVFPSYMMCSYISSVATSTLNSLHRVDIYSSSC